MASYLDALREELRGYEVKALRDPDKYEPRAEHVRELIAEREAPAEERSATVAKSEAPRKRAARKVDHA